MIPYFNCKYPLLFVWKEMFCVMFHSLSFACDATLQFFIQAVMLWPAFVQIPVRDYVSEFWTVFLWRYWLAFEYWNKAKLSVNTISHSAQMYGPGRRMTRRPVRLARSKKCSKSLSPVKLWTPCTGSWKFQGTYLWGGYLLMKSNHYRKRFYF